MRSELLPSIIAVWYSALEGGVGTPPPPLLGGQPPPQVGDPPSKRHTRLYPRKYPLSYPLSLDAPPPPPPPGPGPVSTPGRPNRRSNARPHSPGPPNGTQSPRRQCNAPVRSDSERALMRPPAGPRQAAKALPSAPNVACGQQSAVRPRGAPAGPPSVHRRTARGSGQWGSSSEQRGSGAMKQRTQSSHTPPCHRHMVIATNLSSLFDLLLCRTPQTRAACCLEPTAVSGYRMFLGPFG